MDDIHHAAERSHRASLTEAVDDNALCAHPRYDELHFSTKQAGTKGGHGAGLRKNESIGRYQQLSALIQVIRSNVPRTSSSKSLIMPKQTPKGEICPKLNEGIDQISLEPIFTLTTVLVCLSIPRPS